VQAPQAGLVLLDCKVLAQFSAQLHRRVVVLVQFQTQRHHELAEMVVLAGAAQMVVQEVLVTLLLYLHHREITGAVGVQAHQITGLVEAAAQVPQEAMALQPLLEMAAQALHHLFQGLL